MTIAAIISRILEPLVLLCVLIVLTLFRASSSPSQLVSVIGSILGVVVAPPVLLLLWAVKTKRVTNWDVSDRKQRVWVLAFFFLLFCIDVFVISSFSIVPLTNLFLFFFLVLVLFFLITLFWKVSGHLTVATIFFSLLIYWFGVYSTPTVFLLPVLCWSRVVLGRHSILQTIGGILLGILCIGVGIQLGLL